MMPDALDSTDSDALEPTPVWTPSHRRAGAWEWPGLAELMAMILFAMVVLGAGMGMVLQFINPHRRARKLAKVVKQAAREAQAAAEKASESLVP